MDFLENILRKSHGAKSQLTYDPEHDILLDKDTGMKMDPVSKSILERRKGIYLLHLHGDPYERGFAHGKLLKTTIKNSQISKHFGAFLHDLVDKSDFGKKVPSNLNNKVIDLLESWYYSPLEKRCLEETKQEIYGIADAVGIDRKEYIRGTLAPDIMEHLAAGFLKGGKESLGNYYLGGCSAFYARESALRKKTGPVFARNMDFSGVFVWKPALIFSHPTESIDVLSQDEEGNYGYHNKVKNPYVYLSSAGFSGHGLTGFNSTGMAFGTFVCLSKDYSTKGLPTLDFNHYLFTRAESLDGIKELLKREELPVSSPHTVFFADKDEAFTLEVDASNKVIRPMPEDQDIHIQTNHFLNPILKKKEMEFPLERANTVGRYRLIKDALEHNYGNIDVQKSIDIISSNLDISNQGTSLVGDFPAQGLTLTSVIFQPSSYDFYVATGNPPAVCYNDYEGFNLMDELQGKGSKTRLPSKRRSNKHVFGDASFIKVDENMKKSLEKYLLSQQYLNKGRLDKAVDVLGEAIEQYPEPSYEFMRGLLYMKQGNLKDALEELEHVEDNYHFSPIKEASLKLWKARCLDVMGQRKEAKTIYDTLIDDNHIPKNITKAIKSSLKRPFSLNQMPGTIDYGFVGPLEF